MYCILDCNLPETPWITSHPQDIQAMMGHKVLLEVTAYGVAPLHYQWYFEGHKIPGMYVNLYYVDVYIQLLLCV